ncbi:MAG: amino acid permease [Candidatus Eisenbacteria bacterium]|nr:amino acid permease [Candidatus Eisenbacteria bacterium]
MTQLRKELGLLEVFCIASGAMISSGLFVLPGIAFSISGPAVFLAYLLAAALVVPTLLSKAELATAMPKAGGDYFFVERSMGAAFGAVGGMAAWFSLSLKSAFALVGMGSFAVLAYPDITPFQIKLIAVAFTLVFMFLNLSGAKHAGRFQSTLVVGLLGVIIFYLFRGMPEIDVQRYVPFAPNGASALFATAGLVFVSYGGLTKAAAVAEEVKNPSRNVPLGMFLSFGVVTFFYVMAVFTTVGVLDGDILAGSTTPLSTAASHFMGTPGLIILAVAAILAFITTGNAGILSASRTPMAMSKDGVLPAFLGRVNQRCGTPHWAILVTGGFMIAFILAVDIVTLVKIASTMKIILFLLVNVSVIIMRESGIQHYRPTFRSPAYPWLQIAAIVLYGVLVAKMGIVPITATAVFFGGSLLWFAAYRGLRGQRDSGLVQLVRRVTDRGLVDSSLDAELREILKVRDEIVEDRFDELIKRSTILDLQGGESLETFFARISKVLGHELHMEADRVFELLMEREAESTTALRPGLAIPHIIVEGEGIFDILLARSKEGITFSEDKEPVHAVFVLMGSRDERNYHLRALMHIAQITQDPDFDKKWLKARGPEELRHLVLLGKRRRDTDDQAS